jgi:hypothetical protein
VADETLLPIVWLMKPVRIGPIPMPMKFSTRNSSAVASARSRGATRRYVAEIDGARYIVPKQIYRNRQTRTSGVYDSMNAAAANGSEMRFERAGTFNMKRESPWRCVSLSA